ncbi:MAG TPA: hypothetical protein VKS60_26265 [Stellaceae bacterium]|nr:hypothetical protein [Stellaceae bacterium]
MSGNPRPTYLLKDEHFQDRIELRTIRKIIFVRYGIYYGDKETGFVKSSFFGTKYRINIGDEKDWLFWMPLYSTFFFAISNFATAVNVRMIRENHWALLFGEGEDSLELVAALALIHWRRFSFA